MESNLGEANVKLLATAGDTGAIHVADQSQGNHAVVVWNLSVLILPDEDGWFAQGLEINYGAQGDTLEEAQQNFQAGLKATIHQHLRVHGNIERILTFAPSRFLKEAAQHKALIEPLLLVSFKEVLGNPDIEKLKFPFDGISYRVMRAAA
ncbi:MAG: hypothetical protein ABI824_07425 [Acidobacteriota bacterium]